MPEVSEVSFHIILGPIDNNYTTSRIYTTFANISVHSLGKDSCQGDSGGPLIVRADEKSPMYLRGIVSFGTNKCGFGYPGVYTDLSFYVKWIRQNLLP